MDLCAGAATLVAGTPVQGDTSLSSNDLQFAANTCVPRNNAGPDDFYNVTVGVGQTLTATATPTGSSSFTDLALILLTSCTDLCCWANSDTGRGATPEVLTYTNATGSLQNLVLVVDTYDNGYGDSAGPYTLSIALAP